MDIPRIQPVAMVRLTQASQLAQPVWARRKARAAPLLHMVLASYYNAS